MIFSAEVEAIKGVFLKRLYKMLRVHLFFFSFCVMVRFSPSLLPHPGLHGAHPALMSPGHAALSAGLHGVKQEPGLPMGLLVDQNHRYRIDGKSRHLPASRSGRRWHLAAARSTSHRAPFKKWTLLMIFLFSTRFFAQQGIVGSESSRKFHTRRHAVTRTHVQ